MTITLTFAGYTTLDWVFTSRTDSTTEVTTLQVAALIGTSSPGIGATNAFLEHQHGAHHGVGHLGHAHDRRRHHLPRQDRAAAGAGQRGRAGGSPGASTRAARSSWTCGPAQRPTSFDYVRWLSATFTTPGGGIVDPWNVRPNRMCQVADMNDATARSVEQGRGRALLRLARHVPAR